MSWFYEGYERQRRKIVVEDEERKIECGDYERRIYLEDCVSLERLVASSTTRVPTMLRASWN